MARVTRNWHRATRTRALTEKSRRSDLWVSDLERREATENTTHRVLRTCETAIAAWSEARSCFVHGNFVATVLLCQGLAEQVLAAHLAIGIHGEEIPNRISFPDGCLNVRCWSGLAGQCSAQSGCSSESPRPAEPTGIRATSNWKVNFLHESGENSKSQGSSRSIRKRKNT